MLSTIDARTHRVVVFDAASTMPHLDVEAFAAPSVRTPSPTKIEGTPGTVSYDSHLREALSEALAMPLAERPLYGIAAGDHLRVLLFVLLTHDADLTPVTQVQEWSHPVAMSDFVAWRGGEPCPSLDAAVAYGLHGCEHRFVARRDPAGDRVRVVFDSWHAGMRDRGRALGLEWRAGKRRFADGSSTALGWLAGPWSDDVAAWLEQAEVPVT